MVDRFWRVALVFVAISGCTHYQPIREIKHLGYSDDTRQGKSTGLIEADDCVFHILGYWLGGQPDFARAMANARTGKKSSVGDAFASGGGVRGGGVRYLTNVRYSRSGFDAVVFGKQCIEIRGQGYR